MTAVTTDRMATRATRIPLAKPRRWLSELDESRVLGQRYTLVRASGADVTLADETGVIRTYTDLMSAYGAVNFGHCNPDIRPFDDLTADLAGGCSTDAAEEVAAWLCERLGRPTSKVLFQVGGSFAVATALALAQRARPGRVVALRGAFHGLGVDALAATDVQRSYALQATPLAVAIDDAFTFVTPGEELTVDWRTCSAFIFEPIQGANGYVPIDAAWLREAVTAARAAGVTVIADEVQAGFHRHGPLSPSTSAGLDADVMLFSKSLTNGLFPWSAVVYDERFESGLRDRTMLAHTFQTSALGAAAALAVTRYLDATDVVGLGIRLERRLHDAARALRRLPGLERVYVTGPTLSFGAAPAVSAAIVQACVSEGVIPFTGGRAGERVRVAPPLTIPETQLDAALDLLVTIASSVTALNAGI
ncbi:MAG: aminotransferase class III-fold pyridoxal phosphate-dependent enzyme [Patulibacter sp.]